MNWSNLKLRKVFYQIIILSLIVIIIFYLISNLFTNLETRNITTGFAFLNKEAGFAIGEHLINYSPTDSYLRAIIIGLLNTLNVSILSIFFATILGILIGLFRISNNYLINKLSYFYIEILRNTPLLLQLFFWYALITEKMPNIRNALEILPNTFITNRGLYFPKLNSEVFDFLLIIFSLSLFLFIFIFILKKVIKSNIIFSKFSLINFVFFIILTDLLFISFYLIGFAQDIFNFPNLQGFNFVGGNLISPEFCALLLGLTVYSSAFIAEMVRSGINSVRKEQKDTAKSLGFNNYFVLKLIIFPQSLKLIIPPLISQYLTLVKNSSLALAIGYPDLVAIINAVLNQTGQAIEGVLIIILIYLSISLFISFLMNLYNQKIINN